MPGSVLIEQTVNVLLVSAISSRHPRQNTELTNCLVPEREPRAVHKHAAT
jgi:hypothetical protein